MIIKSLCFGINVSFRSQSRGGVGEDFRQTRAIKKVRPKRPDFSLKNKFNLLFFFYCFFSLLSPVFCFLFRCFGFFLPQVFFFLQSRCLPRLSPLWKWLRGISPRLSPPLRL